VADGKVFVGKTNGDFDHEAFTEIYALSTSDGSVVWSAEGGGSSPAVADGKVFTCGNGVVYAYGTAVSGVTLDKSSLTLTAGESDTLTATVAPENASDKEVTWSSSDKNVATVDSTGKVTAVAMGTATITATTSDGNKTASCAVTVNPAPVPVTGVILKKTTLSLPVGGSETLTAAVGPQNATDKSVSWNSSDERVVTVDSAGKVTAVALGTATITVTTTDGNKTATCQVTVHANYDLTGDGKINILDLISIGQHFGQNGAPGWIRQDVNYDGKIDLSDLQELVANFS
jgi:hypothetical protein